MIQKRSQHPSLRSHAAAISAVAESKGAGLQCTLVPDDSEDSDHIAVVYDKGDTPPKITIHEVSGGVHTVMADGVAIAVVGSAKSPAPKATDVILVERSH